METNKEVKYAESSQKFKEAGSQAWVPGTDEDEQGPPGDFPQAPCRSADERETQLQLRLGAFDFLRIGPVLRGGSFFAHFASTFSLSFPCSGIHWFSGKSFVAGVYEKNTGRASV